MNEICFRRRIAAVAAAVCVALTALSPLTAVPVYATADTAVAENPASAGGYVVKAGDCLYGIARNELGDVRRWKEILTLNSDRIRDPQVLRVGQELLLPDGAAVSADVTDAFEEIVYAKADGKEADLGAAEAAAAKEEKEAASLAAGMIKQAQKDEPAVTALLQSLESDKVSLTGLEYRFKSEESTSRKIIKNAHDMEVSPAEAASTINDVLRYTMIIQEADYVKEVGNTVDALVSKGYTLYIFKNYWANDSVAYLGINSTFRTPGGTMFELQFHTPLSYDTKGNKAHKYYEIVRDEKSTEAQKEEALKRMDEIFAQVTVPAGARDISYEVPKR